MNSSIEMIYDGKYAYAEINDISPVVKGKFLYRPIPLWCTGILLNAWRWYHKNIAIKSEGDYECDSIETLYEMMCHYVEQ